MRFCYLTIIILLQAVCVSAQTAKIELNSELKACILSQGNEKINSILEKYSDSTGDLEDLVSLVISSQISESSTLNDIASITTNTVNTIVGALDSQSSYTVLALEAVSSGATKGVILSTVNSDIYVPEAIEAATFATAVTSVNFAIVNELELSKIISASSLYFVLPGFSCIIALAVTDLPDPDSPTIPSTLP